MWVESTRGEGSHFYLLLPLGRAVPIHSGPVAGSLIGRTLERLHGAGSRRLLVVDPSGQTARVLQRYLDGYEVVPVREIETDRPPWAEGPVHAVILGSDDAERLWHDLRSTLPEARTIPVISCPLQTPRVLARAIGVTDYLLKPFTHSQLRAALDRLRRPIRQVLIAEDDPEMRRLLERMVVSAIAGCTVWLAEDGDRAIALLRRHHPDLILLDLMLPTVSGYAVIKAVRASRRLRGTAIIVVTAHGQEDQTVVASELRLTRPGGLTVSEVARWLKHGLDALLREERTDGEP